MKSVRIKIAEARIPADMGLTHISTSYRISKTPDFTQESDIIFQSIEDMGNLYEIIVNLDIQANETVYCSTRYHYIDRNNTNYQSKWSLAAPIHGDRHGISYPDSIIKTPKVDYEKDLDGIFTVTTNPMEIFTGIGNHETTSWLIKDSDGKIVYERSLDKDNKIKLYPEFVPEKNKAYIIEAIHNITGNTDSYPGKALMLDYSKGIGLYDFEIIGKFYADSNVWHRIKIYLPNFKEYDLEIRRPDGEVIKKLYNCPILVYYVNTFGFKYNQMYQWWVRIRFEDDSVTEWKKEYEAIALNRDESPDWDEDPNIAFLGKITDGPSFDMDTESNYNTCINSYELNNKEFLYVANNKIILMKWEDNRIYKVKEILDLRSLNPNNADDKVDEAFVPYATFTKHSDFEVLIHYRVQNNNKSWGKTLFLYCNYNPIAKDLEIIARNEIDDPINGMGIANHIVRKSKSTYYAIFETDPTTYPIREGLYLLKIELTDDSINFHKYIAAKKGRYAFARLFVNQSKELFYIGGSVGSITNINTSEMTYKRTNNFVKHINLDLVKAWEDDLWNELEDDYDVTTNIASIPSAYSSYDVYDYMPISLGSGDILLWNNCNSGKEMFNQNLLIYSTLSGTFRSEEYRTNLRVPFRNIVRFNNWDILRISSNIESPQISYIYLSVQNNPDDFENSTATANYPNILTYRDKETNLEIPYHFEYGESGNPEEYHIINPPVGKKINWVGKKQTRSFTYSNIVYTRSQSESPIREGLITEMTKGITQLNNTHLRVGLGQCIGDNSHEIIRGANPYPYQPFIRLSDKSEIVLALNSTITLEINHNVFYLDYEFNPDDSESPNLISVELPIDPDTQKQNRLIINSNGTEGSFIFTLKGYGADDEAYAKLIIIGTIRGD